MVSWVSFKPKTNSTCQTGWGHPKMVHACIKSIHSIDFAQKISHFWMRLEFLLGSSWFFLFFCFFSFMLVSKSNITEFGVIRLGIMINEAWCLGIHKVNILCIGRSLWSRNTDPHPRLHAGDDVDTTRERKKKKRHEHN